MITVLVPSTNLIRQRRYPLLILTADFDIFENTTTHLSWRDLMPLAVYRFLKI
jgi:hypothetical protein